MPLHKYMGIRVAELFFEYFTVRFSQIEAYNDPFELQANYKFKQPIPEKITTKVAVHPYGNSPKLNNYQITDQSEFPYDLGTDAVSKISKEFVFTCFSFSETFVPKNLLMWAHYAESHKGICIQFKNGVEDTPEMSKVNYVDYPPTYDGEYFLRDKELYIPDLYCKSSDWEYEAEYRLGFNISECNEVGKDPFGLPVYVREIPLDMIACIYLGVNASPELEKLALEFTDKHLLPLVTHQKHKEKFEIVAKHIHTNYVEEYQYIASQYKGITYDFYPIE